MRMAAIMCLCAAYLSGCASGSGPLPRQYLDESTAATVTVVAVPWIFARERPEIAVNLRDYLSVHALDVNVTGRHRLYFMAHAWSTLGRPAELPDEAPRLEIAADGRLLSLAPHTGDTRIIGIDGPVVAQADEGAFWFYPVDADAIAYLLQSSRVSARLVRGSLDVKYAAWRDGREAMRRLLDSLASHP